MLHRSLVLDHVPHHLYLLIDERIVVKCGLGPSQDYSVHELNHDELGQVQGQHGECDTVEHRGEEGAEYETVEKWLLTD